MTSVGGTKNPVTELNKLEQGRCLSREGKNWFISATDPFHDEGFQACGYPDTNEARSVLQVVQVQQEFGAPEAIEGNWDVNVVMWPLMNQFATGILYNELSNGYYQIPSTTGITPYNIGGITALAAGPGVETYGNSSEVIYDQVNLQLADNYMAGNCRIVGMGLEVVNSTSQLNIQGNVTCWRQPTPAPDCSQVSTFGNTSATVTGTFDHYNMVQPPGTIAAAMLLPGSTQWKAADGVYLVSTMNTIQNPAKQPAFAIASSAEASTTFSGGTGNLIGSPVVSFSPAEGVNTYTATPIYVAPFNMCGAYFTGLSNDTTLQVRAKFYVEKFPTAADQQLVVLAQPSSPYDPCALELYSKVMGKMPVGVPQGENPLGEWFRDVIKNVTRYATPIFKTLSPISPFFKGAHQISKVVGQTVGNKKKDKKAPAPSYNSKGTPAPKPPPKKIKSG